MISFITNRKHSNIIWFCLDLKTQILCVDFLLFRVCVSLSNIMTNFSKMPILISLVCVLVSQGCSNKVQIGWLKINLFSHNSGGQNSEIKESAGLILSTCSRENLFHVSLLASDDCQQSWLSLNCRLITAISTSIPPWHSPCVYICVFPQFSYKNTSHWILCPPKSNMI